MDIPARCQWSSFATSIRSVFPLHRLALAHPTLSMLRGIYFFILRYFYLDAEQRNWRGPSLGLIRIWFPLIVGQPRSTTSRRGIPTCTSSPLALQPSVLPHLENFRSVDMDLEYLWETMSRPVPPALSVITHCRSFTRMVSRTDTVALQVIASAPHRASRFRSSQDSGTALYCQD